MKKSAILKRALAGSANIRFADAVALARAFGFAEVRTKGGHHILAHPGIQELVNLQEVHGKAKPYQVRQLLQLVERYNLGLGDEA